MQHMALYAMKFLSVGTVHHTAGHRYVDPLDYLKGTKYRTEYNFGINLAHNV